MTKSLEVLVAEHDRDVAEGLSDILDMAGHKVHRAFSAEKAEELLRDYDFHVAFVNIKKPGRSAMECFTELRKIKPEARLIMMSAHTIDQLTSQITDGGAVKVLGPPFKSESVMDALVEIGATGTLLFEEVPADLGTSLQSAIKGRNVNLEIAHDRAEALARVAEGSCDILLLDLHLTIIPTLEVFLDLRRQGYSGPTIIFKSYADGGSADGGGLAPDIFYKPFDPALMVELLENIAASEPGAAVPQAPAAPAAPEPVGQVAESGAQAAATVPESDAVPARPDVAAPQPVQPEPSEPAAGPAPSFAPDPSSGPAEPAAPGSDLSSPPPFADDLPAHGFAQGPQADPEPMPPQATEPHSPVASEAVQAADPSPAPQTPPPLPELAVQAEEPAPGPKETGTKDIWGPQSPSDAKLPAGVGISADELEEAVNQPGNSQTAAQDSAPSDKGAAPETSPQDSTPADKGAAPETSPQETRVLVVDDDHDMAEGLAEILVDCGLNVKVAHTSESAVAALDDFDAQIALLDIQLGKNSGLDLIGDLQQKCPNLIVVMVTAQTDQQSAIIALRNGAFDYLNKPLHPQELLAAMDRCFDEIAKRAANTTTSQAANAAEGGIEEATSEYMAKLSHKLRTPLNAVMGFSEILSEEMLGPIGSSQYLDYAHDIKEASKSLINVIDHFEDIDASESGKVEINEEEVDLSRVIFRALKMIQPAVDAGHLTVEIQLAEIPVFMVGDNHKLTQIMLSLLTNAVKFTPSQGKIRFTQSRDEAGGIVIEIIDTGVGIAEEVITQALSSVVEGDGDLDPEYDGGGLGLPLATSMAELHGGKLTLDSEVGEGTTATLVLPPERNIAPKRAVAV